MSGPEQSIEDGAERGARSSARYNPSVIEVGIDMTIRRNRFLSYSLRAVTPLMTFALLTAIASAQPTRQRQDRFKPPETTQTAEDGAPATNIIVSPTEDHRIGPGDMLD